MMGDFGMGFGWIIKEEFEEKKKDLAKSRGYGGYDGKG